MVPKRCLKGFSKVTEVKPKGFYQLMEQLPQERLLIGVASIAHCEALFESTREWVKQRKAFGRRVADLQTVQHKLAEIKETFLNHKV